MRDVLTRIYIVALNLLCSCCTYTQQRRLVDVFGVRKKKKNIMTIQSVFGGRTDGYNTRQSAYVSIEVVLPVVL